MIKMKRLLYLTALAGVIGLSACKNNDNSAEIIRIDSLITVINAVDSFYQSIDPQTVSAKYSEFETTTKAFGKYFTDERDTNWNTITSYANIKKPLRNFLRQKDDLLAELDYSKKQLISLKESAGKGLIPADSLQFYIQSESDAVHSLEQIMRFVVNEAKTEIIRFDSLQPVMLQLLETYKKRNPKGLH